jgi:hypothetical protein
MPVEQCQIESEKAFDAVAESRRWKQAVAAETVGMGVAERMAWFRAKSSVDAIREQPCDTTSLLREEPPAYGVSQH